MMGEGAVTGWAKSALACLRRRWKASLRSMKSGSASSSTLARLAWGEQVPLMVATTSATIRGRVRRVFQWSRACFLHSSHLSAHVVASKTSIKWLTMCSSKALKPPFSLM